MVLHLDMATRYSTLGEAAPTSGDKAFVDQLFGFSDILGADYSGGNNPNPHPNPNYP